jgi:L-histidine N-alpha-methyltransferase
VKDELRAALTGTPRRVPTALLYDELGSMLFEAITLLPEYGVTRAGFRVLTANAAAVVNALDGPLEFLELGPGSGRKALVLLEALAKRQKVLPFIGVDVSQAALDDCERTLNQLPQVQMTKVCALYHDGLVQAARHEGHRRSCWASTSRSRPRSSSPPTTTRWASPPPSTRTCWCGSTASGAPTST